MQIRWADILNSRFLVYNKVGIGFSQIVNFKTPDFSRLVEWVQGGVTYLLTYIADYLWKQSNACFKCSLELFY